ncbi:MAG: DUF4159 domain-containing protein [Ignavibacteria bacterium]|nr:DUF4159 domain-containing protein [Ignavibacteria bacterium]MBT8381970.1 DUF4159 domain-containing protein [Ignavibacteria bacterium]MBT8393121.1 DUF4159 domain-containing protein [Ignavibacteria bacterium]NNJ53397.1 DUF4159 domain-containing protein [Ignavibacteriaceae bacterium]NNL20816.1 DUF4159 domain-containing protein [Ignavibacteriaceae bacterium]
MKHFQMLLLIISCAVIFSQSSGDFQIARLKYNGGGDWYNDPSAEVNLLNFIEQNTNIEVDAKYQFVEISSDEVFSYPFLFMTGHGNVVFSKDEAERLRLYLENGGFIYIDDDYGFNNAVRREMKKVFPEKDFVELPFSYGLYNAFYNFENGPPKTHEHDKNVPQGFGIFLDERLAVYFTYESNPSDGWADATVHNNPPEKREEALKFGTNIVVWALSQ